MASASISAALHNPRSMLDLAPSAFSMLVRTMQQQQNRAMHGYMINRYHYWGHEANDPLNELLMRLVFELVIGKLELRDLASQKWRWTYARDEGHKVRIDRLVRMVRARPDCMAQISKCRWLCI